MREIKDLDLERLNGTLKAVEKSIDHLTTAVWMVGLLTLFTLIVVALAAYVASRPESDEERTSHFDFEVWKRIRRMGRGAA